MADKSSILKAFNKHFFDFLDDISVILPENNEVKVAKSSFSMIKMSNPTIILKVWAAYVYAPYKDVIDNGDIEFFFNKDYGKDLSSIAKANEIMKMIDNIRMPIKSMNEANRNHSMKYIQILSQLSSLYA